MNPYREINIKIAEVKGYDILYDREPKQLNFDTAIVAGVVPVFTAEYDWTRSESYAISLFKEIPSGVVIQRRNDIFVCKFDDITIPHFDFCVAICLAWLAWKGIDITTFQLYQ